MMFHHHEGQHLQMLCDKQYPDIADKDILFCQETKKYFEKGLPSVFSNVNPLKYHFFYKKPILIEI